MKPFLILALLCLQAYTTPQSYFAFGGLPAINYSSDAGLGLGVVASMYRKGPEIKPYRYAVDAQIFFTTLGQHAHYLRGDWLEAFHLPLRLRAKAGFFHTTNENYCGKGGLADCYQTILPNSGDKSKYFLFRYFEIYGTAEGRWRLTELPHKIELVAGWRGSYYWPGDWDDYTPYPGSLYVRDFPADHLQRGFASVFEGGIMFDGRDNEPSPTKGYWAEATARGSSSYLGSTWDYGGFNLSLRGYWPFDVKRQWVLAAQGIFDGLVGDAPVPEIVRVGGSLRAIAYGGDQFGRGLREEYFPGRVKAIAQFELRYQFISFDCLQQHFDLSAVAFADLGAVYWNWNHLPQDRFKPQLGTGVGIRITWNETFVIRADLGMGPAEHYAPRFYLKIGNTF